MDRVYPFLNDNIRLRREEHGVFCIDRQEEKVWMLSPYQALIFSLSSGRNTISEISSFVSEAFSLSKEDSILSINTLYRQYKDIFDLNPDRKSRSNVIDPFDFVYNASPERYSREIICKQGFPTYSAPLVFVLSLTRACNMFCKYCYKGTSRNNNEELSLDKIIDVIDQAGDMKVYRAFVTGGEPTLKKGVGRIVRHMLNRDIFPYLSTNALDLSSELVNELRDSGVEFIQVSFDSSDQGVFEDLCGVKGAFSKVVGNIKMLCKSGIKIRTKAVITRKNAPFIREYAALCHDLGVGYVGFSTFFPGSEGYRYDNDLFIPLREFGALSSLTRELQEEYEGKMFVEQIVPYREWPSKDKIELCGGGVQSIGVFADGTIHVCDLIEDTRELSLGNIKDIGLKEAWFSDKAKSLRNFKPEWAMEPCRSCELLKYCRTGCYSFSKTCYGNIFAPDPRCPRAPKLSEDYPVIRSSRVDFD